MAASGELQKVHKKCDEMESAVDTAYIKAMDLLSRTEFQINQAENDVYEDLNSNHDLSNFKLHGESLFDHDCLVSAENYRIAKEKIPNDPLVTRLKHLIKARYELIQSKIDVQQEYVDQIIGQEPSAVYELQNF